jgi:hypothetical protein
MRLSSAQRDMMRAAARAVASAVGSAIRIDVLRLIICFMGGGGQGDKRDIGNRARNLRWFRSDAP